VEGLGQGDWKLAAMLGAFLGWQKMLLTIFAASVAGTLVGALLIVFAGKDGRHALPLGTFLGLAGILVVIAGDPVVAWYGGFFDR
jgi:leader peptidase (prepilin peptidase)/N-methyltransferase